MQGTLDGLAHPIAQTDFVVVDLETTGGSAFSAGITELAAVRTRGGRAGQPGAAGQEFATLVNPGRAIPPHVAMLTGITDALVAAAPDAGAVLPRFMEFAAGAVLVAHNAPFDLRFLTAACAAHNLPWPRRPTLDTAALARQLLTTDEVHDCKLGTLAEFFGAGTRPRHRALDDARATAAVLHGLIERLAERSVHTFDALRGFAQPSLPRQRRRMRQLTAGLPSKPGVCLFTAADGRVLHVMRSSDMHARACGYFTAAQAQHHVGEMVGETARILPLTCVTALDAQISEIRLVALHRPGYGNGRPGPAPAAREAAAATTGGRHGTGAEDGHAAGRSAAIFALAAVPLLVAARPRFSGGWDVTRIRYGRLDGTAVLARGAGSSVHGVEPAPAGACRVPAAPAVPPTSTPAEEAAGAAPPGTTAARHAETACLLGWLESPGVRLIKVEGAWCCPVRG